MKGKRSIKRQFTLIELLTCVVIIAILMALLLPVLARAKYRAQEVICANNLKQQFLGLSTYSSDHDLYYPQVGSSRNDLAYMHNSDNAWDIRPIMRGSNLGNDQRVLECPLAAIPDASGDRTNYNMYFTAVVHGKIGGLGPSVLQYDPDGRVLHADRTGRSMTTTKYYHPLGGTMRRVGQSWRHNQTTDRGKHFNLLLADRAGYGAGMGQGRISWSNHKGWGPPPPSGWVASEWSLSWAPVRNSYEYPAVEGNFLATDGHFEKHRMPGWGAFRDDFTTVGLAYVPYTFLEEE